MSNQYTRWYVHTNAQYDDGTEIDLGMISYDTPDTIADDIEALRKASGASGTRSRIERINYNSNEHRPLSYNYTTPRPYNPDLNDVMRGER